MKRKSLLFLLLFALIAPWAANAQVQIGSGETTNSYLPSYSYYNYSISQQIYTADEINASGNITSIAFYNGGTAKDRKYDIYMALTDKSAFESTTDWIALTDANIVYHGTEAVTMTVGAWTTFTFDTPFAYNGTSNLVVCMIDRTGSWSSGMACRVFDATNQSLYAYSDSYSSLNPNGTNGTTALTGSRPSVKNQIILGGIQQAYPAPLDLACTGLTGNSATLSWTEVGTATSWQICLNGDETNPIPAATNPYTLTGLTAEQVYTAKVRGYYDATHQSPWSGSVSFEPTNKLVIGSGTSTSNYVPANNYYNYSLTQQIYTAAELGAAGSILSIDFYKSSTTSMVKDLDIYMVSTTKNAFESTSDWIPVTTGDLVYSGTVNFADNAWTSIELTTPFEYDGVSNVAIVVDNNTGGYVSSTPFLVFTSNANANQAIYYYSDYTNSDPTGTPGTASGVQDTKNQIRILKGAPSTCPAPTNLAVSASKRSAELSWTENGEANEWQICLDGDETNLIPADSNPFTLTGLTPETTYNVKVRAYCGEDDQSRWTSEVRFTTEIACPAPTALNVDPLTPTSATLNWEGSADQYNVQYRPVAHGTVLESIDFENSSMGNWTTIDADGDGYDWVLGSACGSIYLVEGASLAGSGHESSQDLVTSGSYSNYTGAALTPDNYLVSPQVALGGKITFWACGQDASYAAEVFGVAVSTTGNTDAADFTTISTWTMTSKGVGAPTMYTRSGNRAQGAWYQFTANLDAYAGQTGYVAIRHYNCTDMFMLDVDDIVIEGAASSEWTTATVNTNHLDITGLAEMTDYEWQVQAVCGGEDGESLWASSTFTTPSMCDAPFDLNVPAETLSTTSAGLAWTGYQDGFEVWYRPLASGEELLSMNFNDTLVGLGNWTNIDADGDGYQWVMSNAVGGVYLVEGANLTGSGHESSVGFVTSGSYSNVTGVGALTPDNYLVSPQVQLGGAISFWACGQDASYAAEHFGVAVSTTSNTDASAFTTIWESTMTAKSVGAPTMYTRSGNRDQGTWYKYTVELEGYSGQGYVAIRHFGCTDQFMLNVDDIVITAPTENPWLQASTDASPITIEDLTPETTYEWKVRGENRDCGELGYTEFSETSTFTTHGNCDNPNTLTWESTATTATLSWIGYQDSFDVTYYTAALGDIVFEDDFLSEGTQIDEWVTTYDEEVDETSGFYWLNSAHTAAGYGFGNAGTVTYLISPEFDALEGAAFVEFYYMASNEDYPEESFKIGYSTTTNDVESFTFGEENTVTGEGWFDADLPEGTKYFAIQYTSTHTPDPDYADLYVTWFSVVDNYVAPGEPTTLEGVTSPVTVEGLEPTTVYYWEVEGINEDCGELDAVYSYFMTTYAQTIELAQGLNWFSTNLEITLADLQAALRAALPSAANRSIKIKSKNGECTNVNAIWTGQLKTLDVAQMYKITVPSACTITLSGWPIDPTEHPITIVNGANWIGFPLQAQMSVGNAFDGIAVVNDVVKSQDGQAKKTARIWTGALKNLEPGKGYIYNSVATEDKVFVYPTTTTKSSTAKPYMPKRDKVSLERTSFRKK